MLARRELIANTFRREFRAISGMADLYRGWAVQSNAVFHYVSGSPWQLYPSLSDFARHTGFPPGTFHLRQFRLKDRSAVELENRTLEFKFDAIERLMRLFPSGALSSSVIRESWTRRFTRCLPRALPGRSWPFSSAMCAAGARIHSACQAV